MFLSYDRTGVLGLPGKAVLDVKPLPVLPALSSLFRPHLDPLQDVVISKRDLHAARMGECYYRWRRAMALERDKVWRNIGGWADHIRPTLELGKFDRDVLVHMKIQG